MSKRMLLFVGLLFSIFSVEVSCMGPGYFGGPDHVGRVVGASTGCAIGTVGSAVVFYSLGLPVASPTIAAAEFGAHGTLVIALGGDKAVESCLEKGRCCSRKNANYGGRVIATMAPVVISSLALTARFVAMNS